MGKKFLLMLLLGSFVLISGCYSCHTWMAMQGKVPVDPNAKFMWDKGCHPVAAPMPLPEECQPPKRPARVAAPKAAPVALNAASRIYPCDGCGVVRLDKMLPAQIQTGADFEYKIRVTNLTDMPIADVVVTDTLISNFQYKTATPTPDVQGNKLIWLFPSMQAHETREIVGIGVATASGIVQNCVDVTYRMPLCVQSISVQPKLAISKTAPAEVSICDPIDYSIRVENTGTGAAKDVRIIDQLPNGLVTAQGSSKIDVAVGDLMAGTARTMNVVVKAQKAGVYKNTAIAVAAGGLKASSAEVTTAVKEPKLSITKTGPAMQYLDKAITYNIEVTNTGNWPAVNTLIEDEIPAGAEFVSASKGGVVAKGKVLWKVASLNPGATAKVSVTFMPDDISTIVNTARASAVCAETVSATAKTQVKGVPAILLEVIDVDDPIRIGEDVTYRIMVTNQGTATGTNITVKAMLEPEMQYVSNAGATRGSFNDATIAFTPLPALAPKARASWEVVVKAKAAGDVRFKVALNSDQLGRDVEETESTHFYE